ncbi:hypothetical protein E2C01_049677 [Portunus trituberculatus]|uniref:Uncharacterized protein n=1 Tax=Portunus trituberculatus TaxID=210409 RepID=A0A5B7GGQ1_PORTR|nr:hypothetical protein [Portunus trituberculatus]
MDQYMSSTSCLSLKGVGSRAGRNIVSPGEMSRERSLNVIGSSGGGSGVVLRLIYSISMKAFSILPPSSSLKGSVFTFRRCGRGDRPG